MIGQIWSIWCSNWRLCPQDLNWLSSSSVTMISQKSERKGASGHDWDCAMQHFSSELLRFKLMYQFMLSSLWSIHRMRTNLFSNFPKTSNAIVTLCIITDINILHSGENSYFYLRIHRSQLSHLCSKTKKSNQWSKTHPAQNQHGDRIC